MTPSEAQRLALREQLIEKLEEGPATTLMESLPPMDWNELATKADLAALEERVNVRFEVVDARFAKIDGQFAKIDGQFAKIDGQFTNVDGEFTKLRGEIAELRGEMKLSIARMTYVILVGMAALVTPLYIALFTGPAG